MHRQPQWRVAAHRDHPRLPTDIVGSSPRAPISARILTANLSYDTELAWNANPERDVVGYEAVDRDGNRSPVAFPIPATS